MRNHWVQKKGSQKSCEFPFKCTGRCTFDDCPITFDVSVASFDYNNPPKQLNVLVKFDCTEVKHRRNQRKARQIRGPNRKLLKEELKHTTPSALHNKRFSSLSYDELKSGKRDKVSSSLHVIQKISSEANGDRLYHKNLIMSLLLLDEEHTANSDRTYPGLIRRITAKPFSVSLFSEEGIRIFHYMAKKQTLFLDATGTLLNLKGTQYEKSTCLYYSLVIDHPSPKCPPVAVAELITTEHSVMAVSHFLQDFRRHEGKLYGYSNTTMPSSVIIDRSLVLLLSFLQVFNVETLNNYLHRCFMKMTQSKSNDDHDKLFIFACISHVMNSAKHDMKKLL